jgi:hypothetical protein
MKKEVTIHIIIDDESEPASSFSLQRNSHPNDHYIEIYRNNVSPKQKLDDLLAHELGHSIQRIFQTEAVKADPRMKWPTLTNLFGIPPEAMEDAKGAEKEAWDYARKMIPINEEDAERDLGSYKND